MRVLLDENVPTPLRTLLVGLDVTSLNHRELGWKGVKNGELLRRMEGCFDVLVTADRSLYAQQNLRGRSVAILVLPTNRRRDVESLAPDILAVLKAMKPGRVAVLERHGKLTWRDAPGR